jgi:hypothetical protein
MTFFARAPRDHHNGDTQVAQARVDAIVKAARAQRPSVPVRRPPRQSDLPSPAPSTSRLDQHLQQELAYARRLIEAMGDTLCDDPILLSRHQGPLQTVDLVAQMIGHIASVVGAADRDDAVAKIGMVELRNRLMRASDGAAQSGPALYRSDHNPFSHQ